MQDLIKEEWSQEVLKSRTALESICPGLLQNGKSGLCLAAFRKIFLELLQQLHVLCLPPLRAFDDVELHRLAFFQTAEAIRLNSGEVNEHIFSIFTGNKAIALRVIEPLHCTLFHVIHAFLV